MSLNFKNLRIGARLALGFGILLALLIALAVVGLINMGRMMDQMRVINDVNNKQISLATAMTGATRDVSIYVRNIVLVTAAEDIEEQRRNMQHARETYDKASDELQRMFSEIKETAPEEKALMQQINEARDAARPLNSEVANLGAQNRSEEALRLMLTRAAPATRQWLSKIVELRELEARLNQQAYEEARQSYETSRSLMIGSTIAGIVLALIAAWLITRSITRPIGNAVQVANAIAGNRLDNAITVDSRDETGQLLGALQTMQDNLRNIVQQIQESTDAIGTASREIAAGNSDLSQRTEEQASALEETASSMEELTSTVKQNADSAREANQQARSASNVAVKGGEVVSQVVVTMEDITSSSKKIVDIISVIDGIAFQTNILALNAAVEAARAGEQGRGFAVVAGEVRSLAQRSAAAAKEIKGLISDSVSRVENGSRLVEEAGATMNEIVDSVKRVTDLIAEITAASVEQSAGIEQVNTAITQMDEVTQQNAALVEEAAAAAESLEEQAQGLVQLVSVFTLDANHRAARTRERPAAAQAARPAAKPVAKAAAGRSKPVAALPGKQEEWEEF